jgi:hypothetical protein
MPKVCFQPDAGVQVVLAKVRRWPTAADLSTSTGLSDHVAGLSVQQCWNAQEV